MFLGASAITVFEVIDVFVHHGAKKRARRKRLERAEKEKNLQNNPPPVAVPLKRSRHHPEMPFDDDPFYHPPFHPESQHQYAEPEYSEIRRPRQKRPHSRPHDQRPPQDRNRPSGGRRPRSKNYDNPSAYHLQPDQPVSRRRSRSKSPRPHHRQ